MRLKHCFEANFNVRLKDKVNVLVQTVNKSFEVWDLPNEGIFYKNLQDITHLNSLVEVFKKLNFSNDEHESENYFYTSSQLDIEETDIHSAAFIELNSATEYDTDELYNEIIDGELILDKKTLGNFKSWQTNVLADDQLVFFAKKKFVQFFEENKLRGARFKPVLVKSLTGETKPSRSVFWAQFDQEFNESRTVFRRSLFDKYSQPIPQSILPNFIKKVEGVDIFFDQEEGVFVSQSLFRLMEQNALFDDQDGAGYWDVGFYGGEASAKLKQQLIEQCRFDEAFEE
jgi:hypothetical protein